jgi:hypothetical protein
VELGSPDDSAPVGALAGEVVDSDSQSAGPEGGLAEGAVGSAEAEFEDWMARVCLPLSHLSFCSNPAERYSVAELAFADLVHSPHYFAGQ